MKFKIIVIIFALSSTPLFAEYIFLKDGSIVAGKVINETADFLIVQESAKSVKKIPQNDVLRTIYREMYLGKQLIQLTSGERFEAFLVYEDRNKYYFRKELNNPEEFSVEREKVLNVSRSNPTELEARVDYNTVYLKWKAPYKPPKKYSIYLKSATDKNYNKIAESFNPEFTVKDLLTKKSYSFLVKGVNDGVETLPSNNIVVVTTFPPGKPYDIQETREISPDKKKMAVSLKWKEPADKDGRIVKYIISEITDKGLVKVGETTEMNYRIDKLDPKKKYQFHTSAIDNDGAESELPAIMKKNNFGMSFSGGVSIPAIGPEFNMLPGFNIGIGMDYRFFYSEKFYISGVLNASFQLNSNGNAAVEKKNLMTIGAWAGLGFGYRFVPLFGLELKTAGGYVYSILDNLTTHKQGYSGDAGINLMLEGQFYISDSFIVSININYMSVYYLNNFLHEMQFGAGAGFRL